jgi:hypothetical protein
LVEGGDGDVGNRPRFCHKFYRRLSHQIHVLSDPVGSSQAARDGETTDQGAAETGVFDDQLKWLAPIVDPPVGAVNEEEDALTRHWPIPTVYLRAGLAEPRDLVSSSGFGYALYRMEPRARASL